MYDPAAEQSPRRLRNLLSVVWRKVWWHHVLHGALRGIALGAIVGLALVVAALWESQRATWLQPHLFATCLALGFLFLAALRGPTPERALRLADRRLGMEDRLSTAHEILVGRLGGTFAARQLDDALWRLRNESLAEVAPLSDLRRRAILSLGLLGLFVASLSLADHFEPRANPVVELRRTLEEAILRASQFTQATALPLTDEEDMADPFAAPPPSPLINPQTEAQLREQLARSRNQEAALSRLARALTGTAAAREVGEQLQQGNYEQAAESLRRLAQSNDQLSQGAKMELADALSQAAAESSSLNQELARQEEQAARALGGRDYRSTQQALEQLSRGMEQAGREVIPQQELAQAWQQLQDERRDLSEDGLTMSEDLGEGEFEMSSGGGAGAGAGMSLESDSGAAGGAGGPGTNVGNYDPNSQPTRLNVAGKELEIEGRPSGSGEGRARSSDGPAVTLKEGEEVDASLEGIPQPTEPVRDTAERTRIPLGHLQAVHDYFQSGDNAP